MAEDIPPRVADRLLANCSDLRHGLRPYYEVDAATGCWNWLRHRDRDGYGRLCWYEAGVNRYGGAHRIMYVLLVGPIPVGLVLDHVVCDSPPCCNPAHVAPVTNLQNISRSPLFPGKRTQCPHGHPYDEVNTRRDSKGGRVCVTCARKSGREREAARRLRQREERAAAAGQVLT